MSNTVASTKGMSTLVRPKFGPGMLLQHDDLDALHAYTRELNRLMFRSLFGCGVVCGLVVKTTENCGQAGITVGAGVALNCSGDPIYVPRDQSIVIDPDCDPALKGPLWVVLCGTAKCCGPRPSMCSCDDDEPTSSCTRERYGFEIRVVNERPSCACQCAEAVTEDEKKEKEAAAKHKSNCGCVSPRDPCYTAHYEGLCECTCGECTGGGCDCVLLAQLNSPVDEGTLWTAEHSVRRFVRPVLIADPQVALDKEAPVLKTSSLVATEAPAQDVVEGKTQLRSQTVSRTVTKQTKATRTPRP